jgi:hypothetical protein
MPKVVKDEIVFCPMSAYALVPYAEARQKEREEKQKKSTSTWDELQALASESSSASYRFRSRAACNFVFPKGIPRPFPSNKRDFKESAEVENNILGDNDADAVEDDAASQAIIEEEEQDAIEDGEEQEQQGQIKEIPTDNMRIPYKDRIRLAIEGLRSVASNRFKLSTSAPQDEQLANYSGKFVEILSRIQASPGSSLVYSQFKTLEGIGVFSIVLDSNGYAPLKLMGPDDDLYFAPETEHSLRNNPTQPRYIIYSGEESKRVRQTLINVFNTKVSSLPPKILNVLNDSGLLDPVTRKGNFKGEICKVFMITGAGAEGLSLRNVRTVHIMEPYWNTVRTDQVKGRAVRICSHSDLPYDPDPAKNQRTVEVFTYISKISDAMKKARTIDQTLITMDEGITTDEHILSISREKEQLGQDFLKAMKEGAVDCVLNQTENEAISCFVYDGKVGDFMYDPRIREDKDISDRELIAAPKLVAKAPGETTTTTNQQQGPQTQKATIVTWQKKQYFLIDRKDASGDYKGVFDISDRGFIKELGRLATDSTGKKRLQFYA